MATSSTGTTPACAALAEQDPAARDADVLACSSAGGGLRIAVVGNEELVTAEAGRRVALSSGGKVVLVLSGGLDAAKLADLRAAEPDVVLLVGGTDGGNAEVLEGDADFLAAHAVDRPGRRRRQRRVAAAWSPRSSTRRGTPHVLADNVVPRIGVLAPDSARARDPRDLPVATSSAASTSAAAPTPAAARFTDLVRGATPDVVLTGVELLARGLDDAAPRRRRRGRRRRRRRDDRRAQRGRARPRGQRPRPRGGRHHPGDPHRRGRPRHALVGDLDGRGGRSRRPATRPPYAAASSPTSCPTPTPSGRPTSTSRPPRCGSPSSATPVAARSWSAPRAGSSSAAARTSARSTCWSGRVACCATAAPTPYAGCCCRRPATPSRAGGSCRATRWWSSTATTSWPRPACWPRSTRSRRTGWSSRLRTAGDSVA